jgi:hypothetical protein
MPLHALWHAFGITRYPELITAVDDAQQAGWVTRTERDWVMLTHTGYALAA